MSKHLCLEDGSEHEDSDSDDDTVAKVTEAITRCSIQVLQHCFVEQGFRDTYHTALDMCMDRVFAKAPSKIKPTSLD